MELLSAVFEDSVKCQAAVTYTKHFRCGRFSLAPVVKYRPQTDPWERARGSGSR